MDCTDCCENTWRRSRNMNILKALAVLHAVQALEGDLQSAGVVDEITALMPELNDIFAKAKAALAKVNLSQIESDVKNILTQAKDLL